MPTIRVPNAGSVGLIKDLSQSELPINAWTDARNIRFLGGSAWQFFGYSQAYNTAAVVPYHLLPIVIGTARYWIYASLTSIRCTTITAGVAVHTNLSGATYAATPNSWTSTLLGGIPILNNSVDKPLQWDLNTANDFATLDHWDATSGATKCKAMRGYKNFLVALAPTMGGVTYNFMVKWSTPAVPGAVPATWDTADTTADAGQADLATGYDPIVDGLELRDSFIIYKEASVWRCTFGGGQGIFRFEKVLGTTGAMNRNCIVEVDGYHAVFAGYDCIVHDGQSARSVLDNLARRWLYQNIDVTNAGLCFVMKAPFFNEVMFCFPSIGSAVCNKAIVWNWKEDTVSPRDIASTYCGASGPVDNGLTSNWSQNTQSWAATLRAWNGPDLVPSTGRAMIGGGTIAAPRLYLLDGTTSFDGALPVAYLERRGLHADVPDQIKLATLVRPRIFGSAGKTVNVRIGGQEDPWAEPDWSDPMPFIVGETAELDCDVAGRYLAIRYESGSAYEWRLDGYEIDVELLGHY